MQPLIPKTNVSVNSIYSKKSILKIASFLPNHNLISAFLGLSTTMLGACILALPATLQLIGLYYGLFVLLFSAWVTYLTFKALCVCCEATGEYSIEAISYRLFDSSIVWTVRILTFAILLGMISLFNVVTMDLLEPFLDSFISRSTIGFIFSVAVIPLALSETMHQLRYANLMVILCVLYILITVIIKGISTEKPLQAQVSSSTSIAALTYVVPVILYCFSCQLNVPRAYYEVQNQSNMFKVNCAVCAVGFISYAMFSIFGSKCFNGKAPSDILTGFPRDDTMINGARLSLALAMFLKTPITYQPLGQVMEMYCLDTYFSQFTDDKRKLAVRFGILAVFMLITFYLSAKSNSLMHVIAWNGAIFGNLLCIAVPGLLLWKVQVQNVSKDASFIEQLIHLKTSLFLIAIGLFSAIISALYILFPSLINTQA